MADGKSMPVELSDEQAEQVAGGAIRTDGPPRYNKSPVNVDGESTDDKHKNEIG